MIQNKDCTNKHQFSLFSTATCAMRGTSVSCGGRGGRSSPCLSTNLLRDTRVCIEKHTWVCIERHTWVCIERHTRECITERKIIYIISASHCITSAHHSALHLHYICALHLHHTASHLRITVHYICTTSVHYICITLHHICASQCITSALHLCITSASHCITMHEHHHHNATPSPNTSHVLYDCHLCIITKSLVPPKHPCIPPLPVCISIFQLCKQFKLGLFIAQHVTCPALCCDSILLFW